MTVEPTTGTPGTLPGGGNAATTGTPAGAVGNDAVTGTPGQGAGGGNAGMTQSERDELERLRKAHEQHLAEKSRAEENARRLEQLERERALAATPPTAGDPRMAAETAFQQQVLEMWNSGDPTLQVQAQEMIRNRQTADAMARELHNTRQLLAVPDADRAEVERLYTSGQFRDIATAHEYHKGKKAQAQLDAWETERRRAAASTQPTTTTATMPASTPAPSMAGRAYGPSAYQEAMRKAAAGDAQALEIVRAIEAGRVPYDPNAG